MSSNKPFQLFAPKRQTFHYPGSWRAALSDRLDRVAFGVILAVSILLPSTFCCFTHEAFEFPKFLFLAAMSVVLVVLQLSARLWNANHISKLFRSGTAWLRRDGIGLGVAMLAGSAVLSTIFSSSPRTSFNGAHDSFAGLVTIGCYGVLFASVRNLVRFAADRKQLLIAVTLGAVAPSVYAATQFFQADPVLWDSVSDFAGQQRPFGSLGHANHLAGFLVMILPVTLALAVLALHEQRRTVCNYLLVLLVLFGCVILVSLSRAAWAAALATASVACGNRLMRQPISFRKVVIGAAFFVFALLGMVLVIQSNEALRTRMETIFQLGSRPYVWNAGWRMFLDHPLLGAGLDTFSLNYGRYRPAAVEDIEWDVTPAKAHNEFIQVLATQGVVGGISLLVLLTGFARSLGNNGRPARVEQRSLAYGIFACGLLNCLGFIVIPCGALLAIFLALLPRSNNQLSDIRRSPSVGKPHLSFGIGVAATLGFFTANLLFSPSAKNGSIGVLVLLLIALALLSTWRFGLVLMSAADDFRKPPSTRATQALPRVALLPLFLQLALLVLGGLGLMQIVEIGAASRQCENGDRLAGVDAKIAEICAQRAFQLAPNWPELCTMLGATALKMARASSDAADIGKYLCQSRTYLQAAVDLVPNDAYTHANLARILEQNATGSAADFEKAQGEFDIALQYEPFNPRLLVEAGAIDLRLGFTQRARERAGLAARHCSNYGRIHALESEIEWQLGHRESALRLADEACRRNWHNEQEALREWYARYGLMAFQAGDLARSAMLAEVICEHWPDWTAGHLLLAGTRERQGQLGSAKASYQRVLELNSGNPYARAGLQRLSTAKKSP